MGNITICAAAIAYLVSGSEEFYEPVEGDLFEECLAVADYADEAGLDPVLIVSLAWSESRLNPAAVSNRGAYGTLQVKPIYHCTETGFALEGCDLYEAGLRHLNDLIDATDGDLDLALCRYNCGRTCYEGGRRYADRIQADAFAIYQLLNAAGFAPAPIEYGEQ